MSASSQSDSDQSLGNIVMAFINRADLEGLKTFEQERHTEIVRNLVRKEGGDGFADAYNRALGIGSPSQEQESRTKVEEYIRNGEVDKLRAYSRWFLVPGTSLHAEAARELARIDRDRPPHDPPTIVTTRPPTSRARVEDFRSVVRGRISEGIDVRDIPKLPLLEGLLQAAREVAPLAITKASLNPWLSYLDDPEYTFEYVLGRRMKIKLYGPIIHPGLYDIENGVGCAQRVVDGLRRRFPLQASGTGRHERRAG